MNSGRIDLVVKSNGREIAVDLGDLAGGLEGSKPFLGDALLWIQAAAQVQNLTRKSGALDVEGIEAHRVEIQGLARGGRVAAFKEAALRVWGPPLHEFANLIARKAMQARQAQEPDTVRHKLLAEGTGQLRHLASKLHWVGGAHIRPAEKPKPDATREAWIFPRLNKVMLRVCKEITCSFDA